MTAPAGSGRLRSSEWAPHRPARRSWRQVARSWARLPARVWAALGAEPVSAQVPGTGVVACVAVIVGFAASVYVTCSGANMFYSDAQSHLTIARRILDSKSPGLAQLGTVWLPMPHLLLMPFVQSLWLWRTGWAGCILGTGCLAVSSAALWRIASRIGLNRTGKLTVLAVFLANPTMLYSFTTALTEPVLITAMLGCVAGLARWATSRRRLSGGELAVFAGIPAGAAVLSRYEGWALLLAGSLFVFVVCLSNGRSLRVAIRMTCCFGAVPAAAITWWLAYNFAIYGRPLEFMFGPYSAYAQQKSLATSGLMITKGNLGFTLSTYHWAVLETVGLAALVIALAGAALLLWKHGVGVVTLIVALMGTSYFFSLASLYLGQTTIDNDHSYPTNWWNNRFALSVFPAVALLCGVAAAHPRAAVLQRFVALAICGALIAQNLWWAQDLPGRSAVIAEAAQSQRGTSASMRMADYLRFHYRGGGILMDESAGGNAVLPSIGIPLDQFDIRASGDSFAAALADPAAHDEWIFSTTPPIVGNAAPAAADSDRGSRHGRPPGSPGARGALRDRRYRRRSQPLSPDSRAVMELSTPGVPDAPVGRAAPVLAVPLAAGGELNAYALTAILAIRWGAPLIDLGVHPPTPEMLAGVTAAQVLQAGWLALSLDGDHLTVATTLPPSPAITAAAAHPYPSVTTVTYRTITARDLTAVVSLLWREQLLHEATSALAETHPERSAHTGLTRWQLLLPAVAVAIMLLAAVLDFRGLVLVVLIVANASFAVNVAFRLFGVLRFPLRMMQRVKWRHGVIVERLRQGLPAQPAAERDDHSLPVYTVLIPAFHEANIIGKVAEVQSIDYPKHKLDVLLLLEEDDIETIAAAKASRPPAYVRIILIPRGSPQTKPRACNYGLAFARGRYTVIYDSEDRPEPLQLRRMVTAFAKNDADRALDPTVKQLVCIQCALNYYNAGYNVLTRMFAIEYSFWFDAMLPGLDGTNIPIPLGGTSNHFDTEQLRLMGGWDPYNVTEDADLGLRAAALGFQVGVDTSTTWEEACSQVGPWIKQRTRWVKGYMITGAVNFRQPLQFWRATGLPGMVSLVGLIMATPVAFMLYPLLLSFSLATWVGTQFIGLDLPGWLLTASGLNMLFGMGGIVVLSGIVASLRHGWRVGVFAALSPLYWLLHSVAAWRAAWQTIFDPHRWEKTPHGLTEDFEDSAHLPGPAR